MDYVPVGAPSGLLIVAVLGASSSRQGWLRHVHQGKDRMTGR